MHIAIDARIINSSTGTYVERLLTYLEKIDTSNQYSVLVPTKDKNFWTPTNPNFTVRTVDYANYSFGEQIGFKKYLDALHPDLVHFCMPQQPILYRGKKVTTIHDLTLLKTWNSDKNWLIFHIKQLVGRFVFHHVIRSNEALITDSDYSRQDIINFDNAASDKTTTVYLSADINPQALEAYQLPFDKFILYVGAQSDYKNIPRLAAAHQKLLAQHPDLGLVLVGKKGTLIKRNESTFEDLGYKNIVFSGFISDAQRDWLYTNCQAYIFPSLMEGFGLPGLEAMGYGAPVVSSNATCLPEVYGDAALYFDPKDIDDMAHAIDRVLSDQDLRNQLIEKGHQQRAKYSWQRMAEQTHAVYLSTLGR